MFKTILLSIFIIIQSTYGLTPTPPHWDHDISTLKLLQIVHRHGERTALKDSMPSTDPYRNITNWPEGFGQLTKFGKYRMYKMGQYLRVWYDKYLGDEYSPREVYARSSIEHRCLESASMLLSGLYPPNNTKWHWNSETDSNSNLGKHWQPFPIETFMPKDEDTLLVPHKNCPKVSEEHNRISDSDSVKQIINDFHKNQRLSRFLKDLFNESIDSLYRGQQFWDTLKIESENNPPLNWPQLNGSGNYTQTEIVSELEVFSLGSYVYDWNRDLILTVRIGKLMETLVSNMRNIIDNIKSDNNYKFYDYSTHDTIVVPLLQALNLYDNAIPNPGSAVIFELHQNSEEYFVRIFYYNNDTLNSAPIRLIEQSFSSFEEVNKKWFYTDFDKMCGIVGNDIVVSEMTFMVIGIGIGIALLGLNLLAYKFIKARKDRKQFYITK